ITDPSASFGLVCCPQVLANITGVGYGQQSQSLEIVVDTDPPPISFGDPGSDIDGLIPDSDTGVSPPNPDTLVDLDTNDVTPTFWGRAEANTTVRLFLDANANGAFDPNIDIFIGQDQAIPIDGTNQEPDGYWQIQSVVSFNDPNIFPDLDGVRTVFAFAEDLA